MAQDLEKKAVLNMAHKTFHVLLVEDDDVDVMAVRRAFQERKIANPLTVVRDANEALAALRGDRRPKIPRPYLILLDLKLPGKNGIEFLQELRADPEHNDAVVFVLTTSRAEEDKAAAYGEQVAGYIVKENVGDGFLPRFAALDSYWTIGA